MGLMNWMMNRWMKKQSPEQKQDMMAKMMPKMMKNCLTPMSEEERRKMFSFCHTMLGEMEEKFLASARK